VPTNSAAHPEPLKRRTLSHRSFRRPGGRERLERTFRDQASRQPVVKKYEGYGLIAGLGLGSLIGVMFSGPHFHDWPAILSLVVILGGGAVGAAIGYLAVSIAYGSRPQGSELGAGSLMDTGQVATPAPEMVVAAEAVLVTVAVMAEASRAL